jgi:hypothetical protein
MQFTGPIAQTALRSHEKSQPTLQKNLSGLDFSLPLPDVMIMADDVDALTQTMESFTKATSKSAVA